MSDAWWGTASIRTLVDVGDLGALIRIARTARGWRQSELGAAIGYSASTISRIEAGTVTDLTSLRRAAAAAGVPAPVFGAAAAAGLSAAGTVTPTPRSREDGEPMRRRDLMAASLSVPALLTAMDSALLAVPDTRPPVTSHQFAAQVAAARARFDSGELTGLLAQLPALLGAGHAHTDAATTPGSYALLASVYDLATDTLDKLGHAAASRTTADRAVTLARVSGDPIAQAAAARSMSIVLRHEHRNTDADRLAEAAAARLAEAAAARLDATGLPGRTHRAAYAQALCTAAYTAAQAGHRDRALDLIADARRAAAGLPTRPRRDQPFAANTADVALYDISVHWALGDPGAAIAASRSLHDADLPTPERRARLHTDLARAWWMLQQPDQTAHALLTAHRHSPAEVLNRARIHTIVTDLARHHRHADGVAALSTLLAHG